MRSDQLSIVLSVPTHTVNDLALISSTKLRPPSLRNRVGVKGHPRALAYPASWSAAQWQVPKTPRIDRTSIPQSADLVVNAGPRFFMAHKCNGPLSIDAIRVAPPEVVGAFAPAPFPPFATRAIALSARLAMSYAKRALA
jgi:hypothetical protein